MANDPATTERGQTERDQTERDQTERDLVERLGEVFGGKPWIVAGEVLQGIVPGAAAVQSLGASDVILIASRQGVGEVPDDLRIIMSDGARVGDDASMIERMHDNNRDLHDLPAWVIDEVNDWDPEHQARVIASFTIDAGLIAERATFGARQPSWATLEDKIVIRSVWQQAGIATAPDRVVAVADIDELLAAHDELATRLGTVWAADNDQGWHGGGKGTYWVPTVDRARRVAADLAGRHRQVRIQPFLEGVPCSIHGMVLRDATLAFRPCEMIMLLDWQKHSLEYARASTFWDPADADRQEMRAAARAIGEALRDRVGYRGVFTVDGVLTADGFRPTEVNPRFGAALPPLLPTADGGEFKPFLVHLAAVEGELDDFDTVALEALIVERMDANRAGSAFIFVEHGPSDGEQQVTIAGTVRAGQVTDVRVADGDGDEPLMTAVWGTEPGGGMIFVRFTNAMPTGPPVAPTVVAVRAFLAKYWGLEMVELQAIAAGIRNSA